MNLIEDLLCNKSIIIPFTDCQIQVVSKWALEKKAPFHNGKNSFADALILLSTIDFIKNTSIFNESKISDSIFVSNNSRDFSDSEAKMSIHSDLAPYLKSIGMLYEINIGKILDLSKNIQIEIDEFWEEQNYYLYRHIENLCDQMRGK